MASGRGRHAAAGLLLVFAAIFAIVFASPAAAEGRTCAKSVSYLDPRTHKLVYKCVKWVDGDSGGAGTSTGGGSPTCDLQAPATFCIGTAACWYTDWGVPWAIPPGTKPSPDAVEKVEHCNYADGGVGARPVWVGGGGEPPLLAQAQEAIGNLTLPTGSLTFSPANRAVVGLPTWYWVTGVPAGDLTGSSAFGLVAIATPDHLEVDPGDGTGALTCPWTTSAARAETECAHTYDRASVSGAEQVDGQPAYRAGVTAVWAVEFRDGGVPVTIPGAPAEVRSPQWLRPVPVAEVQALVTVGS